jgi:hypothetical protein
MTDSPPGPGCALGALGLFASVGLCGLAGFLSFEANLPWLGALCAGAAFPLNLYAFKVLDRRAKYEIQDPSPHDKRVIHSHMMPLSSLMFLGSIVMVILSLVRAFGGGR